MKVQGAQDPQQPFLLLLTDRILSELIQSNYLREADTKHVHIKIASKNRLLSKRVR